MELRNRNSMLRMQSQAVLLGASYRCSQAKSEQANYHNKDRKLSKQTNINSRLKRKTYHVSNLKAILFEKPLGKWIYKRKGKRETTKYF